MFTVQPVQMPLTGAAIARPELSAVQSVAAVPPAGGSSDAHNDLTRDPGADSERAARILAQLRRDPSTPAGPPPAFKANVLELQRARLMDPPDPAMDERDTDIEAGQDDSETGDAARSAALPEDARGVRTYSEADAPQRAYEEARVSAAPASDAA